jgi:sulfite reductase alpha subunit-like flavoprotein
MSVTQRPPIPNFLPENAPFTPEQRTWLNGLFAGLFGLENGVTPLSPDEAAKLIPGLAPAAPPEDDAAPWHDPAIPLSERMTLAEGKPLPRRMMAAMAQQDCGQCGYNCKDYAAKIFDKSEKRLNLCAPDMLFQLFSYLTGGDRRQKAKALASGGDPDGDSATIDVLAALQKFSGVRPDPEAFIESLDPLQPRVYSISSSLKANPGRVSLTVDAVRYAVDGRARLGVCSTFLANRVAPGDRLRVYVQKAAHFALPADPSKPVIMIGPGTGVAPFRAFLQERQVTQASGKNWLFFGHQRRDFDFFYEDEFTAMKSAGLLTRLTLAWSRDAGQKIYVQHRMREVGRDLWSWLNDGAYIYVCGDALKMAKDVEAALIAVIAEHGGCTPEIAATMLAELKTKRRYQTDVY